MRIECPACDARYQVPDGQLAPGRQVRCARCGHGWVPGGTAREAEPEVVPPLAMSDGIDDMADEAAEPEPSPPSLTAHRASDVKPVAPVPAIRPPASRALVAAWAVSLAMVVAGLAALVLLREPIARAWPPSIRLYAALHLPVTGGATEASTTPESSH